jgi:hypothetical protein
MNTKADNVIDFTRERIKRAEVSDAMKDFLRDMRDEYGDEAVRDELGLLDSFGIDVEWTDDEAS